MKTYIKDGRKYTTASRWIKVNFEIVTPRHSLYEYGDGSGLEEYGGSDSEIWNIWENFAAKYDKDFTEE